MKKAFTIVELLVVVGILGVLLSIVMVAASGVQKGARDKRASAMRSALEQGIAAYYAQEGQWPKAIESRIASMDGDTCSFTAGEVDDIFREVVGKAYGKGSGGRSMLVDASALFVAQTSRLRNGGKGCFDKHGKRSEKNYCGDQGCVHGIDFSEAANPNGKSHISLTQMSFGYPGHEYGRFCRFWISYNAKTDSVTVTK